MYDLDSIKSRGREWRNSFPDAGFVGELEVSEQEIKQLCPAVRKFINRASWDEDICAALAVTVVNLAYYYPEEMDEGFRWHVLHKLLGRRSEDVHLWQHEIGEPVLRLLEKYFRAQDIPGPFRYVRPIMLQAGVPSRLADRFAQFFLELVKFYGLHFTEVEYIACHEKTKTQSSWLNNFLRTNGWQYCHDIARIIRHLEDGILPETEVRTLLPRFRLTVQSIRQQMAGQASVKRSPTCLPKPKLVLDRNNLRLAIQFAAKGLDGKYQWADGRKIRTERYILKEEDFPGLLTGRIAQPSGTTEFWSIRPWVPRCGSWATFRSNDASLETHSDEAWGKIRPGRHIIALAVPFTIPPQHIIEEYGELYVPGYESSTVTVADCELPPGFELPEIGFSVGDSASESFPTLRFVSLQSALPYTTNVFVGELPCLKIDSWTESFADRYLLIHDNGSRQQRLPEELYRSGGTFQLRVGPPAHGRVHIEPKGRTPKGFLESSLHYVALPAAKLTWPTGLHEPDESLTIEMTPASKFRIEWQESLIEPIEAGRWRVPPQIDFIDGQVFYEKLITFNIAGPIPRLRLRGEALQDRILWQDNLKQRSQLVFSLSSEEADRRVDVGVADERGFIKCLNLGPIPRNGRLQTSTDSIRDAFNSRACPAGRITIRLSPTRVVKSDEIFLHDGVIRERLFDDSQDDFRSWITSVPESVRLVLTAVREMSLEPVDKFSLDGLILPEQLREFLFFYEVCASVVDWHLGETAVTGISNYNLRNCLIWYINSKAFIDGDNTFNPDFAQQLLRYRPRTGRVLTKVRKSPNLRWRNEFAQVLNSLHRRQSLGDYKRIVREWSGHCKFQRWQAAARCKIGRAPGGANLTVAAADYFHACEERQDSNIIKSNEYFFASNTRLESARTEAGEGSVWEIASALRVMIFFHIGHNQFAFEANELLTSLGDHWSRLKLTLNSLMGHVWNSEVSKDSLGLSDITPHNKDLELEEALVS